MITEENWRSSSGQNAAKCLVGLKVTPMFLYNFLESLVYIATQFLQIMYLRHKVYSHWGKEL